jgi:hypothetical protein
MMTCEDYCGALEVLATLDDAELEVAIIGIDRRIRYLDYLLTISYDIPVLRFLIAVLGWLTGDYGWQKQQIARLSRLTVEDSRFTAARSSRRAPIGQKPLPSEARPCVAPTGPPSASGVVRQSALFAA